MEFFSHHCDSYIVDIDVMLFLQKGHQT